MAEGGEVRLEATTTKESAADKHRSEKRKSDTDATMTSSENLAFRIFLRENELSNALKHFPADFTLGNFRAVTEDDLADDYGIDDDNVRAQLMRAVNRAREEYDEREEAQTRRRVHSVVVNRRQSEVSG
ncbi:uncharacterized protein LOC119722527 [Patiria miniata]|uniref:Uncharacterized protein n=1 Tax=Patiria miniata TaxID=46514 RepID=A0A913ZC45_PATMI|nr:uncharacterized protein LOC119722527 [Patiria miniata]XP_038048626.1 uncharacterized protein LOC119722527 [Patiria miniata]